MIAKKSKKANLERKRFAFFQIGLLISGSLCLAAFEYSSATPDEKVLTYTETEDFTSQEIIIDPADLMKEEVESKPVVNLENAEDVIVKDKLEVEGDPNVTDHIETIQVEGNDLGGEIFNNEKPEPEDGIVFINVSKEPEFPGGQSKMYEWIGSQIKYPEIPAEMGIGGQVVVQFVVNTDGSIVDVNAVKSPHEDLSKEAIRVVKMMPAWNPGEQAGKKVRVRYTMPFVFRVPR